MYDPYDHYWDGGIDVFSSARQQRVAYADAAYQSWLAAGNVATSDPGDSELREVLAAYEIGLTPAETAAFRQTQAKRVFDESAADPQILALVLRAFALITLDEVNSLRQWVASFKVEVEAASSLANLKTRVASLPEMPDRTALQLRQAIRNKIDEE